MYIFLENGIGIQGISNVLGLELHFYPIPSCARRDSRFQKKVTFVRKSSKQFMVIFVSCNMIMDIIIRQVTNPRRNSDFKNIILQAECRLQE